LADIGLPPFGAALVIPEIGPEDANGADYTPGPTDPGFSPAGVTYHIISDTPEPGSIALMSVVVLASGCRVLRRR
jgi:hypothetical protein